MEFISEYVQTRLDYESAERDFLENLEKVLKIPRQNVKDISFSNRIEGSSIIQVLEIDLTGSNKFRSEDIAKIKEMTLITPNCIQIDVGEIHL